MNLKSVAKVLLSHHTEVEKLFKKVENSTKVYLTTNFLPCMM